MLIPALPDVNRQMNANMTTMPGGTRHPAPFWASGYLCFRHRSPTPGQTGNHPFTAPTDKPEEDAVRAIVCRQCLHVITDATQHRIINGSHVHTFANPDGIIFEIGCYHHAKGCGYIGSASSEFTWFNGYLWRIAVCGYCLVHLGWRFSGADGHFFHGLITSRLIVNED